MMAIPRRKTLNISPEMIKKLKRIQGKIQSETGERISLQKITSDMINECELDSKIISKSIKSSIKFD